MAAILLHCQVYVSIVTTHTSICPYCYHISKCMSLLLPHLQVFFSTVTSFFLSIDTESINFDHHLRCGGCLKFEFSKREKHSGRAITTLASACLYCYHTGKCISVVSTTYTLAHIFQCYKYNHIGKYLSILFF